MKRIIENTFATFPNIVAKIVSLFMEYVLVLVFPYILNATKNIWRAHNKEFKCIRLPLRPHFVHQSHSLLRRHHLRL